MYSFRDSAFKSDDSAARAAISEMWNSLLGVIIRLFVSSTRTRESRKDSGIFRGRGWDEAESGFKRSRNNPSDGVATDGTYRFKQIRSKPIGGSFPRAARFSFHSRVNKSLVPPPCANARGEILGSLEQQVRILSQFHASHQDHQCFRTPSAVIVILIVRKFGERPIPFYFISRNIAQHRAFGTRLCFSPFPGSDSHGWLLFDYSNLERFIKSLKIS